MITLRDLVKFILHNRWKGAFPYDENTIALELLEAEKNGVFSYSTNEFGILNGVAVGTKLANNIVLIHDALTTENGVVRKLLEDFMKAFPTHALQYVHHGKRVTIKQPIKLVERLH